MISKINNLFRPERLLRRRMVIAVLLAVVVDGVQLLFQAIPGAPEIIDVIAMGLTVWLLGFHLLLLPTFALEFIHFVDALPTWTACVLAVIALRKREQPVAPPVIPPAGESNRAISPPPPPLPSTSPAKEQVPPWLE